MVLLGYTNANVRYFKSVNFKFIYWIRRIRRFDFLYNNGFF